MPPRRAAAIAAGLLIVFLVAGVQMMQPRNDRDWRPEHAVTPAGRLEGDTLTLDGVRNFRYAADSAPARLTYETRQYRLSDLREVWYGISHFGALGFAHTFLSFGFADGDYLALSIEARLEKGESYNAWKGLFRAFELIYVFADERDAIGLRSHVRGERVLLYRLRGTQETGIRLLTSMLEKANALARQPAFYNTLTDNCTTGIVRHAENLPAWRRYLDPRLLLPGYSDALAYDYGVIDTSRPLSEQRAAARIDPDAAKIEDPAFSQKIRAEKASPQGARGAMHR